ncbi:MAG: hypothetical protein NTY01_08415 [Verrucomicrobia bacterium]|nr:hypothetical protein [Verrucomicrobiota bacterium]
MAASADIDTPQRPGDSFSRPVAASTIIYAGTLVAINAAGNSVPAADSPGLKVDGVADEQKDNSSGDAGDLRVNVTRGVRCFANSAINPVTVAEINKQVYVADNLTVNKEGGTNHIQAGLCLDVDDDGVWVDTRLAPTAI